MAIAIGVIIFVALLLLDWFTLLNSDAFIYGFEVAILLIVGMLVYIIIVMGARDRAGTTPTRTTTATRTGRGRRTNRVSGRRLDLHHLADLILGPVLAAFSVPILYPLYAWWWNFLLHSNARLSHQSWLFVPWGGILAAFIGYGMLCSLLAPIAAAYFMMSGSWKVRLLGYACWFWTASYYGIQVFSKFIHDNPIGTYH